MVAVLEYGPYVSGCGFSTQSQTGMPTQVRRYGAVPAGSSVCALLAGAMPMSMPLSWKVFTRAAEACAGVYRLMPAGGVLDQNVPP